MLTINCDSFEMFRSFYCLLNIEPPVINNPPSYALLAKILTLLLIIPPFIWCQRVYNFQDNIKFSIYCLKIGVLDHFIKTNLASYNEQFGVLQLNAFHIEQGYATKGFPVFLSM